MSSGTAKKAKDIKYRQITDHFRTLINNGELKPGTRLPTAQALAKIWETNHTTIQSALVPLVNEGLIERKRRLGTFVRDRHSAIASVAIYCGANLWSSDHIFYQLLYKNLEEIYRKQKTRSVLFVDNRPQEKKFVALPDLQRALDRREVQGIIALMLSSPEVEWLGEVGVPVSMFGYHGLHPDRVEMFDLVHGRFAADGCRSVGLIFPLLEAVWHTAFKRMADRHGLETNPKWMQSLRKFGPTAESVGYHLFKNIWSQQRRPDGIFVYPDGVCRGVILAALEMGLRIPQDLRLILHRNTGIDYLCPWKIPFLVTDIKEAAHLLMRQLDLQFQHKEAEPISLVTSRLVEGEGIAEIFELTGKRRNAQSI